MQLTILEVYKAIIEFLDIYYQKTKSDDLGGFLGGIDLTIDDRTMDPAAWNEWIDSIEKITKDRVTTELTHEEAYRAMIEFLNIYYQETTSKDVGDLLNSMALTGNERITSDPEAWKNWIQCVNKVLSEKTD
jgi:hypothetical protein